MDSSKFLITGGNGQLGLALKAKYPDARATDVAELDITNQDSVKNFDWNNVSTILNAAGYTNVDGAETSEGRMAAWRINANGAANLALAAAEHGITIVHISSEYIFDGSKSPHVEDESPSPLSAYGASKAAGDVAMNLVPKHYICRTSWLIGEGKNFVRTMLELGKKGVEPKVVGDQTGRLTFTSELVRAIDHLLSSNAEFGTYNITNDGDTVSWADITRQIFKDAGFDLQVTDITTQEYFKDKPEAAKRPLQSTLDLAKIKAAGFQPNDWQKDLADYVKKEIET